MSALQGEQTKRQDEQVDTSGQVFIEKTTAGIKRHPNASLGASGGSIAVFLVWAISLVGVRETGTQGAATAVAFTTALLVIGRHGLRGICDFIWRGDNDNGD